MRIEKISTCDTLLIEKCAKYSRDSYAKTVEGIFIEDTPTDTQAFLTVDGDNIVFTGQGTTSVTDWMIDFRLYRTRVRYLGNTLVHAGFVKSYNAIRDRVHVLIQKLMKKNEIKGFICTGHSLFGAIATVAALDFKLKYNLPVSCVSFGSPRVGSYKFTDLFNEKVDACYRCVRLKDPIAFTPFGPRFKHVSGGLHFNRKSMDFKVPIYNPVGCRVGHHSIEDYLEFIHSVNIGEIPRRIFYDQDKDQHIKDQDEKKEDEPKPKKRFWFW